MILLIYKIIYHQNTCHTFIQVKYIIKILGRYDKPTGYHLLFLPCAWGITIANTPSIFTYAYFMSVFYLGSICMRAAGCIINDIWDKNIDKKVERTKTRPLASGQLQLNQAFKFLSIHLTGGLVVLSQLNQAAIISSFCTVPIFTIYPFIKRISHYP